MNILFLIAVRIEVDELSPQCTRRFGVKAEGGADFVIYAVKLALIMHCFSSYLFTKTPFSAQKHGSN